MATAQNRSFVGSGILYMRPYGVTGNEWADKGNSSQVNISVEENEITLQNFRGGGGNRDVTRRPSAVTVAVTLTDWSPENLELATRGTKTDVSAGTVTGERHTAYLDAPTPLDFLPDVTDTAASVTVTQDPDGTATTLTEGTDYTVTKTAIRPLTGGAISDGDTIDVDYTKSASAIIQALQVEATELEAWLDGRNDSNGDPITCHIKRLKFGAAGELGLITDEYGQLELTGDIVAADNVAAGESPFFEISTKA